MISDVWAVLVDASMSWQVPKCHMVNYSLEEVAKYFRYLLTLLGAPCILSKRCILFSLSAVLIASTSTGSAARPTASYVVKRLLQHQQLACAFLFEGFE